MGRMNGHYPAEMAARGKVTVVEEMVLAKIHVRKTKVVFTERAP